MPKKTLEELREHNRIYTKNWRLKHPDKQKIIANKCQNNPLTKKKDRDRKKMYYITYIKFYNSFKRAMPHYLTL